MLTRFPREWAEVWLVARLGFGAKRRGSPDGRAYRFATGARRCACRSVADTLLTFWASRWDREPRARRRGEYRPPTVSEGIPCNHARDLDRTRARGMVLT